MILRCLRREDIPKMLEWMHDPEINRYFQFDAQQMTAEKVQAFIQKAGIQAKTKECFHFAIADENNEYMGTISLKYIDWDAKSAEYAISLRKIAQGRQIAFWATWEVLNYAFEVLLLQQVYLTVLPENAKAIRLYERIGFIYEGESKECISIRGEYKNLRRYRMLLQEYLDYKKESKKL